VKSASSMWTVRRASSLDSEAIRRVVRAAYRRYVDRVGQWPEPATLDYHDIVADAEVWVAIEHSQIIGVIVLRQKGVPRDVLAVENVAVVPKFQGRGIGGSLLELAERRAVELDFPALELYTNVAMTEDQAIYAHLGFVRVGQRRERGFERVYLRKELGHRRPAGTCDL
jgi:ribosomal protein S18 acetylase RimI-like enzyme